ncbi:uncharacterized protein [Littorina saxatilis]|uniref:uncharacterized protein isoform X2 n=1 Tax=Littorina saxatilis TaxID=31220 RepID=UPI0038B61F14
MAAVSSYEDDFYRIEANPKGLCLIINNFKFKTLKELKTGPADGVNLSRTFKTLDFGIRYFENLSSDDMQREMECIQDTDHSNYDCFVCCISSHGDMKGVCGSDDLAVPVKDLQSYIFATECPSLAGKPKMFFVDACQGNIQHRGTPQPKSAGQTRYIIADKTDFLVSYATTSDNVSWTSADPSEGSRFFFLLTTLLDRHAKSKTLIQILQMVNSDLQKTSTKRTLQVSEYRSTLSKELNIYLRGKPKVTVRPSLTGTEGQSTTLVCDVQTCPPLTSLQWYKGGQPLATFSIRHYTGGTIGNPSLTIPSVQLDDAGSYHCVASNSLGSTKSDTTVLTVHYKPNVTMNPSQTSTEGQYTTLGCDVKACPPLTSLQWYKGGQPLATFSIRHYTGGTIGNPSLTIPSVQLDDAGSYHCVASNSLGSTKSDTTVLTVHCKPIVKVQPSWTAAGLQPVTLPCVVEAVPCLTSLTWYKEEQPLDTSNARLYLGGTTSNPSLTILRVALHDAGSYHCEASNPLGSTVSGTTKLSVEPIRIILIGTTGAGKSSLGNSLLNKSVFKVGRGMRSNTAKCERQTGKRSGTLIELVDTPGLCDTDEDDDVILRAVGKSVAMAYPGPHLLVLALRTGRRFTQEEYQAYVKLKKLFSEEMSKYLIIVFNGMDALGDTIDEQKKALDEEVKKMPGELKQVLQDANYRYVGMNNKAAPRDKEILLQEVMIKFLDMVRANGNTYYKTR